jgi:hypothetical protein
MLRKVFGYESKTAVRIKSMEAVYQQIVARAERDEFYDGALVFIFFENLTLIRVSN